MSSAGRSRLWRQGREEVAQGVATAGCEGNYLGTRPLASGPGRHDADDGGWFLQCPRDASDGMDRWIVQVNRAGRHSASESGMTLVQIRKKGVLRHVEVPFAFRVTCCLTRCVCGLQILSILHWTFIRKEFVGQLLQRKLFESSVSLFPGHA